MAVNERDYRQGTRARIKGPGTTTSDSVPAMLSKGEFVIKASSAAKIGDRALNHMNRTGRVPMNPMMQQMRRGKMRGQRRVKMGMGGAAKAALGLGVGSMLVPPAMGLYRAAKRMLTPATPVTPATPATPAAPAAPNPNQGGVVTPLNQGATNALERRMRAAGMAKGGKASMRCMACGGKMATGGRCMKCGGRMKYRAGGRVMNVKPGTGVISTTGRGRTDERENGFTTYGYARGGKAMGLRAGMAGGGAHPGFKAVQAKIAAKQGVPMERAGAILAASSRRASSAAKRKNPRLLRVKG